MTSPDFGYFNYGPEKFSLRKLQFFLVGGLGQVPKGPLAQSAVYDFLI
jgi:hypothetical protein